MRGIGHLGEVAGEEEGQVGIDVKLGEELLNTGEVVGVVVLAEVAGQEGAELDEGVVALVEQLPHQLQVVRFSLLASLHFTNIFSSIKQILF